jgi:hypothetical protein
MFKKKENMEAKVIVTEEQILTMPNDQDLGKWVRKKFWNLVDEKMFGDDVEYDHCVICGKQAPYTKNTPLHERLGYVEGAGQSCFTPNKCDKI